MLERLQEYILAHQGSLDNQHELGIHVVAGSSTPFHLRFVRASDPDILVFAGVDSAGNAVELMHHYTQMAVLLVSVPKLTETAYRVGFIPSQD